MKFIILHDRNSGNPYLVNPINISCVFDYGGRSKVCFDGEEYICVKETLEEIAALIEGR